VKKDAVTSLEKLSWLKLFQGLENLREVFQGLEKPLVSLSKAWKNHRFHFPIIGKL